MRIKIHWQKIIIILSIIAIFPLSNAIKTELDKIHEESNSSLNRANEEWKPFGNSELDSYLNSNSKVFTIEGKLLKRIPYESSSEEMLYDFEVESIVIQTSTGSKKYEIDKVHILVIAFNDFVDWDQYLKSNQEFNGITIGLKNYKGIGRSSLELLDVDNSHEKESLNRSDKKMPDSDDTTEASTSTEKVDLDNYYNSVQAAIDEMNNKTGDTLSMERTSVTPGIKINLSPLIASYSVSEQRAIIDALNETFYNIAQNNGVNSPKFYYYVNNEEIAVNRYIMDPSSVKFKGVLKN
ncbi:hypothetical protein GMC85_06230 [Streptococcus parasanguinis]|uniref:hypothetical protein n=1 Tax=Streptococcus parasanguinis TaxID=1318 RepID=UPI0012BCD4ED|nr:hypothetical protein [Streptococcus parasanguinis]MTR53072.1 hypothetical protein [Streptococcus parasanguinis]MTR55067.1 hypothetical protein [Streptococcus parasanguinis]MTR59891.1 hypothetical protein [Streptococcus parasanguinis]MTR69518.1 hypothetical protein [Streptococcus parasanguinis]MTS12954.1 hypothetical protein [Streptococcus parasanguinis]